MNEPTPLPATWSGPWVQLAAFCEKVIQDARGVLSLINVVDRFTVPILPLEGTARIFIPSVYMVLAFKAGEARGRHMLSVDRIGPDGLREPSPQQWPMLFGSEDRRHQVILEMPIPHEPEGVYGFEARIDERVMTRLPLRIVHQPAVQQR